MRGRVDTDWRCPNDMTDDAVIQILPVIIHVHVELLELLDRLQFAIQVSLSRR